MKNDMLTPAPVPQFRGLSDVMKDGFLTCVAEHRHPFVKVHFPTLKQAQALHGVLALATTTSEPHTREISLTAQEVEALLFGIPRNDKLQAIAKMAAWLQKQPPTAALAAEGPQQ